MTPTTRDTIITWVGTFAVLALLVLGVPFLAALTTGGIQ